VSNAKKLVLALVLLALAAALLWRPWQREAAAPVGPTGEAALICVGCGKQFAEGEAGVDLDDAATGALCPACGEKKLYRAHVCPQCGHRYVPKFVHTPGASRKDDKCPKCGAPTLSR